MGAALGREYYELERTHQYIPEINIAVWAIV